MTDRRDRCMNIIIAIVMQAESRVSLVCIIMYHSLPLFMYVDLYVCMYGLSTAYRKVTVTPGHTSVAADPLAHQSR